MRRGYIFIFCFLISLPVFSNGINIIPEPVSIQVSEKSSEIRKINIISEDASLQFCDEYLREKLLQLHNLQVEKFEKSEAGSVNVKLVLGNEKISKSSEGYSLQVTDKEILIRANQKEGVFYGIQSLLQLIRKDKKSGIISIPQVQINSDVPRYQWRGMHLDVGRHFFPVSFIKKYLDLMAFYKMNVFHWHLTEDQGWRIEIKKYPKLTQVGAYRNGSMIGHYNEQRFDTVRYGGFYTQEEIKEVVKYAKERNISVVPEIEMPGHSLAALASYPELSCKGGPFEVAKSWGVFDDVYCTREETFTFLEDVLNEVCELFPGEYIHIGGDECPKTRWKSCNRCQSRMKKEGLKDEHELQSYFIQRIEKYLNAKGKKIIGWDEILEGGLAPNAAVMSWRGTDGGIAAAKLKHYVVMTPGSHCYFDHYQFNPAFEPVAIGGYTSVQKVYSYEPTPPSLTEDEAKYIMGAQGNVWTEYMYSPAQVEYMVFPRMLALSEVLWSSKENRSENNFLSKMVNHFQLLGKMNVNYCKSFFKVDISTWKSSDGINLVLNGASAFGKISYEIVQPGSKRRNLGQHGQEYKTPVALEKSGEVIATFISNDSSEIQTTKRKVWVNYASGKKLDFAKAPSSHYPGRNGFALVDGIRATLPRINDEWIAWSGTNMEVIIDLDSSYSISTVQVGYLHDPVNWIYAPKAIQVLISKDGKNFKEARNMVLQHRSGQREVVLNFEMKSSRYVKVVAINPGKIPSSQPGAGNDSWIFFDEIQVN